MYKLRFLLALAAAGPGLAGCDTADQPLPAHTRAWLHDTHGATLRFGQPGTPATEEVRVQLTETNDWHHHAGKFSLGGFHQELAELRYLRLAAGGTTGLHVTFHATGRLYFSPEPSPTYAPPLAELLTSDTAADELLTSPQSQARAELLSNATLNGRAYARLVHVQALGTSSPPDMPEYWYSKAEGLVAYTTAGGQTWYRR